MWELFVELMNHPMDLTLLGFIVCSIVSGLVGMVIAWIGRDR